MFGPMLIYRKLIVTVSVFSDPTRREKVGTRCLLGPPRSILFTACMGSEHQVKKNSATWAIRMLFDTSNIVHKEARIPDTEWFGS